MTDLPGQSVYWLLRVASEACFEIAHHPKLCFSSGLQKQFQIFSPLGPMGPLLGPPGGRTGPQGTPRVPGVSRAPPGSCAHAPHGPHPGIPMAPTLGRGSIWDPRGVKRVFNHLGISFGSWASTGVFPSFLFFFPLGPWARPLGGGHGSPRALPWVSLGGQGPRSSLPKGPWFPWAGTSWHPPWYPMGPPGPLNKGIPFWGAL